MAAHNKIKLTWKKCIAFQGMVSCLTFYVVSRYIWDQNPISSLDSKTPFLNVHRGCQVLCDFLRIEILSSAEKSNKQAYQSNLAIFGLSSVWSSTLVMIMVFTRKTLAISNQAPKPFEFLKRYLNNYRVTFFTPRPTY